MPSPTSLSTRISPAIEVTMSREIASPMPVPSPAGLVVKKGSKILAWVAASMPRPVSLNSIST